MEIRQASESDDGTVARHYLALWDSYGTPKAHYHPDAEARVLDFLRDGRANLKLGVFLATEDGRDIGSAACQLYRSPYPDVVMPAHRQFGYVWSVYVDPQQRRRGIARLLTERAVYHLRSIGCTTVVLNSSEAGERLYAEMGFARGNERLPLAGADAPRPHGPGPSAG